jgi:FAD/FMN-containing dehydrogenase
VTSSADLSIPDLRALVKGEVIAPDDPEYDEARQVFYGFDRRPAVVVRVANADDVARVVTTAREAGLELAVRGGGHSNAGHGTSDGGIVLDLSRMQALDVDVDGRTAWAETGLTAGAYTAAVAEHALATGFGDTGSVGIGGITLAGGIGFLVRKHGMTIDNLLAADVVTADGELVRADAQSHPDLFWAIRGGGGNFGVATQFRYRLVELGQVYGGILIQPATPEVVSTFIAEAEAAPEELSIITNVVTAPPVPFLPPEVHGRLVVMGLMVYAGAPEDGDRAVAPFRAAATPIADMLRPMRYPEMFQPAQEGYHPIASSRTMFLDELDNGAPSAILEHLQTGTASLRATQLRVLGGAMARVPAVATAFANRARRFMVSVAAVYERPGDAAVHGPWVDELASKLPRGDVAAYVGFLGDEGEARIREAYPPATLDRLAEIKRRYDPTNLFRLNQNVPPRRA